MGLQLVPVRLSHAKRCVEAYHRHHKAPVGALFAVGVEECGEVRGVAIAGRPVNRVLDDGWTVEVTRVAVRPGTKNGCSILYGACRRAAFAMGYRRMVTYTLASEPGTSLRAAGWTRKAMTDGGPWDSPKRRRVDKHPLERKVRWEVGESPGGGVPLSGVPVDATEGQPELDFGLA